MGQENDIQLINQVLKGNTSCFAELVEHYKDFAFSIAARILNNRQDAEEIVQDAFIKVYQNLHTFKQKAKFSTWLYRVVYNAALSKKRIKGLSQTSIELIPEIQETFSDIQPLEEIEENERNTMLESALNSLPEDEKTIIILYYLHEVNVEEIHTITGHSKSNVKIKLFRARKKLEIYLSKTPEYFYALRYTE